jgi:Ser/Thr protein kinase RdoA (MazF antagonist)
LIHGDAHRSNLRATASGVLLSDFDVVAFGPREWDLTPTALAADRFGLPGDEYATFACKGAPRAPCQRSPDCRRA